MVGESSHGWQKRPGLIEVSDVATVAVLGAALSPRVARSAARLDGTLFFRTAATYSAKWVRVTVSTLTPRRKHRTTGITRTATLTTCADLRGNIERRPGNLQWSRRSVGHERKRQGRGDGGGTTGHEDCGLEAVHERPLGK
jgi:hypothetical protein